MALVTVGPRLRDQQRAASETAILDAAWALFARCGPVGTPLREVARDAGCTHALIARHFSSKDGLVTAVADRLAVGVGSTVDHVEATAADPLLGLLDVARSQRSCVQLLVRCALGDLRPTGFPACLRAEWMLSATPRRAAAGRVAPDRRARLCAYAAASVLLGWLTFEGFLVAATRLGGVGAHRRDVAIAAAATDLLGLARSAEPRLAPGDLSGAVALDRPLEPAPGTAKEALLRSAVELFAEFGPASVSVRDLARHAGVNQGLIYRHFGSKQALLAAAIETGSSNLFPAALSADGFDFDAMSHLMHHGSPAPRMIARTLVDDVGITTVRVQFPVLHQLLDRYDQVPTGSGPADLTDPRVAVATAAAMALGSVIWGCHIRTALGLSDRDGIESALADLARHLLSVPTRALAGSDHAE